MEPTQINAIVKTMPWKRVLIVGMCCVFAVCAVIIFAGGAAQGKAPVADVSVLVEPHQIKLGEAAILAVQITGDASGHPSIPKVDGIHYVPMGQSSQYQSINGRVSQITSYLFQIEPAHAGDFTLPPVRAQINGQVRTSKPVVLRVSGAGNRAQATRPRAALPPPSTHAAQPDPVDHSADLSPEEEGQIAFIRVTPARYRAYVGERVPVQIRAFFRQGLQATLNSFPVFQGDAFATQGLSEKPEQTEERLDGIPYAVLTWNTAMSAVKEGEYPVSADLDATLLIPETSRRRHPFGRGFFDDDFFESFFTSTQEETVRLTSAPRKMRVLPLPKKGRPSDFTGAVGRFKMWASASPENGMVGDPITLKITVKGTGNFDRVSCPRMSSTEGWRTYTPTNGFKPSDAAGYEGRKSFEQAVIPLDAGIDNILSLTFSYFDTVKEKYVTLRTRPIQVTIAPDAAQARHGSSGMGESDTHAGPSGESESIQTAGDLAPIHVGLGPVAASLTPIFENPWFMGAQGIPLGALFVGLFLGRRNRRRSSDPSILRKKEVKHTVSRSVKEMDRAIAGHDVQGFFNACRRAAQERLGEAWGQAPESITLAEIKMRTGENGAGIRHVFENADAVAYSGRTFSQDELREFRDMLVNQLKKLRD